jgi:hypothetical protein
LGLEGGIFRACGEFFVSPWERRAWGEDADIEMGTEGVEKRGVVQPPIRLGGCGEEV